LTLCKHANSVLCEQWVKGLKFSSHLVTKHCDDSLTTELQTKAISIRVPKSLIACSMQIQRGKPWEIWSRVVTPGGWWTHRGQRPTKDIESESFSCNVRPEDWRVATSMPLVVQRVDLKHKLLPSGTAPCLFTLCLPEIATCDQICQTFPLHIWQIS